MGTRSIRSPDPVPPFHSPMTTFSLASGIADKKAPSLPLPAVAPFSPPPSLAPTALSPLPPDAPLRAAAIFSTLEDDDAVTAVPPVRETVKLDSSKSSRKSNRAFWSTERVKRPDPRRCQLSTDFLVEVILDDTAPFPPT